MSYWVRWDSSPNRQLIHQVIDAYEDGLLRSKKEKSRRERRKANKDSSACSSSSSSSAGELNKSELQVFNEDDSGEPNSAEQSPNITICAEEGEEEDGCGEERGAVRRFVSFLGERIWGVWA